MTLVKNFLQDESGATAIEYAMIAAGVALAIVASLEALSAGFGRLMGRITREWR